VGVVYDGAMYVGDGERDRVLVTLREHFVRGRLTVEELSSRAERVLVARSRADLRRALAGLPASFDTSDLVARGRSVAQAAIRGALLVMLTGAYLVFCLLLLGVLSLILVVHGASVAALVALLVVWLVPTYLLSRMWRRKPKLAG
jgi:Flp pilus assembly protein TadB